MPLERASFYSLAIYIRSSTATLLNTRGSDIQTHTQTHLLLLYVYMYVGLAPFLASVVSTVRVLYGDSNDLLLKKGLTYTHTHRHTRDTIAFT